MYQDMETASISSAEAMGLAKCLDNSVEYILDYCCCCIFHRTKYDPFLFRKHDPRYYCWMGTIHVKNLVHVLVYFKSFLFFVFLLSVLFMKISALFIVACTSAFLTAVSTYLILLTGIKLRKFHYFIPYFFTSFVFILIMVIHLFVNFLDSANTHDTLELHKISSYSVQAFAIAFEVYTLISTWRLFNYICDVLMDEEMTGKRRFRTTSEIDAEREREIEEAMREPVVETTESDPLLIHEEFGIDEVEDEDVPSD